MDTTKFTETELEILFNAWALQACERGFVPQPHALLECERMREAGWLERRMLANGDASYWWTPEAELALDVRDLARVVEGRQN